MFLYNGSKNNGNSNNINSIYHHFNSCYMGSVAIMRTPRQQRNHLKMKRWFRAVRKEGEIMLPFIVGILILGATFVFAVKFA